MATFLLIHGACHGGWCWDDVAPVLRRHGHEVLAPDLPCDDTHAGLDEYADQAQRLLADVVDEVIVAGHSLGALTASVVASRRPVRRLTFVGGIIGRPRTSLEELAAIDEDRDLPFNSGEFETDSLGRFRFTPSGARRALYHDCPEELANAAIPRLRFQRSLWKDHAPFDDWPSCEIVSVVCTEDRVVNPVWSRRVSVERLGVNPIELESGHSPFFSHPAKLAGLLMTGL